MTSMTSLESAPSPLGGMTYARFFPSDWRTGCMVLNLEEEGLYIRICMFMYDTGGAPKDNDVVNARIFNVQIQKYRKVLASLVAKGKIIRAQGLLINERVIEELDRYRRERVARQRAAQDREANRRKQIQQQITDAMRSKAPPGQPPHLPSTPPTPHSLGGSTHTPPNSPGEVSHKLSNEINETAATAVPEPSHDCTTTLESRIQKPEEKKERDYQPASSATPSAAALASLNGSAEPMLADIVGWMTGGDKQSAKNWLSTFLGQYAQEVVRESYLDLKTQIAEGKIISRPLMVWSKIAARMKDRRPMAGAAPNGKAPIESRRDRLMRHVQEAAAKEARR